MSSLVAALEIISEALASTMAVASHAVAQLPVGRNFLRPAPLGVRMVTAPTPTTSGNFTGSGNYAGSGNYTGSGNFSSLSPMTSFGCKTSKTAPGGMSCSFRMASPNDEASRSRRWSDSTPIGQPTMLWPPTPSPMATPLGFYSATGFGMPFTTLQPMKEENSPVEQQLPPQQFQQFAQQPLQQQFVQQPQQYAQQLPAGAQVVMMQVMQPMRPTVIMMAAPNVMGGSVQMMPPYGRMSDTSNAGRQIFNEALDHHSLDQTITVDGVTMPLPCVGSSLHGTGRCSPCAWYWKDRGCQNDFGCTYCHICPDGELKNRKKAKVHAIRMGALEPARVRVTTNIGVQARGSLKLNSLV